MSRRTGVAKSPRFTTHSNSVLYRPVAPGNPGIWQRQHSTPAHQRKLYSRPARPDWVSPASSADLPPSNMRNVCSGMRPKLAGETLAPRSRQPSQSQPRRLTSAGSLLPSRWTPPAQESRQMDIQITLPAAPAPECPDHPELCQNGTLRVTFRVGKGHGGETVGLRGRQNAPPVRHFGTQPLSSSLNHYPKISCLSRPARASGELLPLRTPTPRFSTLRLPTARTLAASKSRPRIPAYSSLIHMLRKRTGLL